MRKGTGSGVVAPFGLPCLARAARVPISFGVSSISRLCESRSVAPAVRRLCAAWRGAGPGPCDCASMSAGFQSRGPRLGPNGGQAWILKPHCLCSSLSTLGQITVCFHSNRSARDVSCLCVVPLCQGTKMLKRGAEGDTASHRLAAAARQPRGWERAQDSHTARSASLRTLPWR